MQPELIETIRQQHAPWLMELESLAVNALITDNWKDLFNCLYDKMEQLDQQTMEQSQQLNEFELSTKTGVLSLALVIEGWEEDYA
ncbi:MAG: hypothetical protein F6K36_29610, partial [Symploca sp. SIO3C6]|nr:hypothetical protein [Symploca sp. SIO3C6]